MRIEKTNLSDVLLITPERLGDKRGFFMETWRKDLMEQAGIQAAFVQDNASRSSIGTLRGLHYQHPYGQGKLVRVVRGRVFDVAVDIRKGSPDFGKWTGYELSDENCRQLWVPPGFAHGYLVLSEIADFAYKCTEYYHREAEGAILWNDPDIGIEWPVEGAPLLSDKDAAGRRLRDVELLPEWGGRELGVGSGEWGVGSWE